MSNFKILQMRLGMIQTNVYVAVHEDTGECVIVDPADSANVIAQQLSARSLKPVAILLTHGHFDHIGAVDDLRDLYSIPVLALREEQHLLADPEENLSDNYGMNLSIQADEWLTDGQELTLAGEKFTVIATPGHTEGGACYYLPERDVLFSGDTLFCCSIGRTDFPTGSSSALVTSLREKLLVLPESTVVYPGHNEATSIEWEKEHNPWS